MTDPASSSDTVRPVSIRDSESPPLTIGPQRLHYSFSVALPAIHLTFVSIVQGVVVSQLLGTIPLPSRAESMSIAALAVFVLDQHAYLTYLISGALILLIWKQFVQASLFYTWPLSMTEIALMLLIASAELVAFREIDHFFVWLIGVGLIGIIGGFIRLHNIPLRRDWDYEFLDGKQGDNKIELQSGLLYIALGTMISGFGVAQHYHWLGLGLNAQAVEWIDLLTLTGIVAIVIVLDRRDIDRYIDNAIGSSKDLERVRPAGIRYKSMESQGDQKNET